LRSVIEALAAAPPPRYVLPPAAAAHTRHYMPLGDGSTTKVFDTFVQPSAEASLIILWEANLDVPAREYLSGLLAKLGYLGRAESLCEAELLPADAVFPYTANAFPTAPGEPLGVEQQTFKLLAPQPPADYAAWRAAHASASGAKAGAKARQTQPATDLFAALNVDTGDWRGAGWSQPPGSRWVEYARPATPFKLAAPPAYHSRSSPSGVPGPAVARFAIQAAVRESIIKALSLGERLHAALCSRSDAAPVFSGKCNGQALAGHEHAFYLPECDDRGLLTHVTVFAGMGFNGPAVEALRSLRQTWSRPSSGLKLMLLGLGDAGEFATVPAVSHAREWVSLTPFVPVRHVQRSRSGKPRVDAASGLVRGCPAHDLCRLLQENGLPPPQEIHVVDALQLPGRRIRWANFQRDRRNGAGTGIVTRTGYGFRLRFAEPIQGPLALGYGAHFGLGLFVPVSDARA